MRDKIVKNSGVLRWILLVGCLIIIFGLTYFLGILEIDFEYSLLGAPINSFYGITYIALFVFGFFLIVFSLFLLLPSLDITSRENLQNYRNLFFILGMLGLLLVLYSLLILLDILPPLIPTHKWFDYFLLGLIMLFTNYALILFSCRDLQELVKYNRFWISITCVGIIIEIFALLTYWSLLRIIPIEINSWSDIYFIGIIFLYVGGFPLLISFQPTNKWASYGLGIVSLVLILAGLLTYLAPTLALNGMIIPLSIFKYNKYFDYLIFGALLLIVGIGIASRNKNFEKLLNKYSNLWLALLALGLVQYFLSILMEITDTYFIDFGLEFLFIQSNRGSLLFGMPWNVILLNGLITTLSVLIILGSQVFQETQGRETKQDVEKINDDMK